MFDKLDEDSEKHKPDFGIYLLKDKLFIVSYDETGTEAQITIVKQSTLACLAGNRAEKSKVLLSSATTPVKTVPTILYFIDVVDCILFTCRILPLDWVLV